MIIIQSSKMIGNIITLDESISGNYQLRLFILNNVLYNVNTFNNVVYLNVNSIDYSIELDVGYYTPTTFIQHLETKLTSQTGETFTITKNDTTQKIISSCSSAFRYTFGTNAKNSASKLIGVDTDTALSLNITSDKTFDLSPIKLLFGNIHQDNSKVFNTDLISASFVISSNTDFGNVIKYPTNSSDILPIFNFNDTKQLNIDFLNINSEKIDFNGQEWIMIIEKVN